jgi:hypothetical protein
MTILLEIPEEIQEFINEIPSVLLTRATNSKNNFGLPIDQVQKDKLQ